MIKEESHKLGELELHKGNDKYELYLNAVGWLRYSRSENGGRARSTTCKDALTPTGMSSVLELTAAASSSGIQENPLLYVIFGGGSIAIWSREISSWTSDSARRNRRNFSTASPSSFPFVDLAFPKERHSQRAEQAP